MRRFELPAEMMEEIHIPVVRPYDIVERIQVKPREAETQDQKLERLAVTSAINIDRYISAAEEQPDMQSHFAFLISTSEIALEAWKQYYSERTVPAE